MDDIDTEIENLLALKDVLNANASVEHEEEELTLIEQEDFLQSRE